jgi:quercetin dioxygenase-like cupin family protein
VNEPIESSGYFSLERSPDPGVHGSYAELDAIAPVEFVPGLTFTPILTEDVLVNFVRYEPGTVVPLHSHAESQITFVVDGEFEFDLGGDVRVMRRGTVAVIPPWVPHAARTYESRCLQIDVFQPPRAGLLKMIEAADRASADAVETGAEG